eukprot:3105229-Lingulodinium_polyedra.AAC.1
MVTVCWCVEQAGIAQRVQATPLEAQELVRQMNVHFRAIKQKPFLAWQKGETACMPDLNFPGQKAATRQAEAFGRLPWATGDDTDRALGKFVESTRHQLALLQAQRAAA